MKKPAQQYKKSVYYFIVLLLLIQPDVNKVYSLEGSDGVASLESNSLSIYLGRKVYRDHCASCHGVKGDGSGPAARYLNPRPRDFTRAFYKFRSTPSGELPTDGDLFKIISNGIPQTKMPGWKRILSVQERRDVVEYIKSFSKDFLIDEGTSSITIPTEPKVTSKTVFEGKQLYLIMECYTCHGPKGNGRGVSSKTLKDDLGRKIKPINFIRGNYKSSDDNKMIYRTINTGLDGTPMPSFADVFSFGCDKIDPAPFRNIYSDVEIKNLQSYCESQPSEKDYLALSEEKKNEHVNRRKWALVHYLKSLYKKPGFLYRLFIEE